MISLIPNDIAIAVILVVVALVVLLISRMGLLPSKSLPYIAGALLAVFAVGFANRLRAKGLRDEAEKRRKALEDFAKKAAVDGESAGVAERRTAELAAQQDRQDLAAAKSIALINAKKEEDKRAVDDLHGDELHSQLDELAGRLKKEGGGP